MKSIVAILALAVSAVSAQVYITNPVGGTIFTAGNTETITWINATVETVDIKLRKGQASNLVDVLTIASGVDASELSYSWDVPEDLASGSDYALTIGEGASVAYSNMFTIENSLIPANTTSAAATSSATTTAAATTTPAPTTTQASVSKPASSSVSRSSSPSPSTVNNEGAASKTSPLAVSALVLVGSVAAAFL